MSQLIRTNPRLLPEDKAMFELFDRLGITAIVGADRGANQRADVITQSADGADLNAMWAEFQRSIDLLNGDRNPLLNFLTFPVAAPSERVLLPVAEDFEQATEFGIPKAVRLGPAQTLGYSFTWYDLRIMYTWLFLAESSAQQIEGLNASALEADVRLQFVQVLKTIFNNVNTTATINGQAVNVYKFYNNDGTVPPPFKTYTHLSTHDHYLSSGAATVDAGDLTQIEDHLFHHGYSVNRGYRLVLMVNRNEGKTIRTFVAGAGSPVSTYTFIPNENVGGGVLLNANGGVIARPSLLGVPGEIGTWGPFNVIEEDLLPSGYMFAFATGGDRNLKNPVGYREHDNAALRGLKLIPGDRTDYPLVNSFYQHGFGTGVRQRGGGVVMQITAGAYAIPAAYV